MALTIKEIRDKVDENEMDLSLMSIATVPVKEIASIPKATKLDLSCNQIVRLPDSFCASLSYLVKLDLSKNQLVELPNDIHRMTSMQHLDLYENKLQTLPLTISQMRNLKWLDLKDNPLDASLVKVAGGCIEGEDCKKCALSVVAYFKTVSSIQERERQLRLKEERERKKKEEEEAQIERKKMKQLEKEDRRKKWEEQQRDKELENKKRKRLEEESEEEETQQSNSSDVADLSEEGDSLPSSGWYLGFWGVLFTALVALVSCGIGIYLYCKDNRVNKECEVAMAQFNYYHELLDDFWEDSIEFLEGLYESFCEHLSGFKTKIGI